MQLIRTVMMLSHVKPMMRVMHNHVATERLRLDSCVFSAVEHSKIILSCIHCFAIFLGLLSSQLVQRYERLPSCWSASILRGEWWVWLWTSQGTEHDLRLSWVWRRFTGTANLCCFTVTWRVSSRPFLNDWKIYTKAVGLCALDFYGW